MLNNVFKTEISMITIVYHYLNVYRNNKTNAHYLQIVLLILSVTTVTYGVLVQLLYNGLI